MPNCSICGKPMNRGEQAAIISEPVNITGYNGEYNFAEYLSNRKFIHLHCYNGSKSTKNIDLISEFISVLRQMKVNSSDSDMVAFVKAHNGIKINDLLKIWFSR